MSDPFAAAMDAMFQAPGSENATYIPSSGPAVPIRVIRSRPDGLARFGDALILPAADAFEIRRSDVAAPAVGDVVAIAAGGFAISIEPIGDVEGLTWTCGAEPVT
jgi:hypothetical protein